MSHLIRKGKGQPIRDAMKRAKLSGPGLAEAIKRSDPTGKGISAAAVGRIAGKGQTASDRCRLRTAWLIAEALDAPLQQLFSMPAASTVTVERSRSDA